MAPVVALTGATSGVGRAIARRFARDGAQLGLIARSRDGLDAAVRDVQQAGGHAIALPCDVADADAVEAAAGAIEDALGPIDIWINDAMTTVFAFFEDIEPEEFRRATEVTYLGFVWGTRAALRRMLPRDRGTIVQVGSAMAYRGIPLQSPYCGAKQATKGFQESLRTELRHKHSKVHATMVQLPGLNTPQFEHCLAKFDQRPMPVAPVYQPEVAAEAVHWAAHHKRREVYVGLPTVYTILGAKLATGIIERYLARTAVGGQLSQAPLEEGRPSNLFEPVAGDPGAHGPYDDSAHGRSIQLLLSRHRRALGVAGALAGAAAALAARA